MDKLSLNNKIVSMRGTVERAKVHTAHKLSREIKSLKVPKSWYSEVLNEKTRLKADRLTKELLLMKKLNKDDVSKLALLNTKKTLDRLRTDANVTAEKKVMARLASHPQLIKIVEELHSQFPTWESTFPILLENLGVKVKKSKNKTESVQIIETDMKTIQDNSVSDDETSEGSLTNTPHKVKKDEKTKKVKTEKKTILKAKQKNVARLQPLPKIKAVGGKWEVEENKDNQDNDNIDVNDTKLQFDFGSKTEDLDGEIECGKISSIKKKKLDIGQGPKSVKINIEKSMSKGVPFKSNSNKVMRFSDLIKKECNRESTETNATPTEEALVTPTVKAVDSFFVSEDGQTEFFSTVAVKEPVVNKDDNQPNKYDKMREKYFNDFGRIPNRKELRLRERQPVGSNFKSFQYKPNSIKDNGYDKIPNTKDQGIATNKKTKSEQKITKWQGETIPFKKTVPKVSEVEGPVHPSWEAKRKQKEMLSISAFQGKKITFDD